MAGEVLRQLCPAEAQLLSDPTLRPVLRFRCVWHTNDPCPHPHKWSKICFFHPLFFSSFLSSLLSTQTNDWYAYAYIHKPTSIVLYTPPHCRRNSLCVCLGGANIYMYIINIYLDDDKIGLVEQSIRLLSCSKCFWHPDPLQWCTCRAKKWSCLHPRLQ